MSKNKKLLIGFTIICLVLGIWLFFGGKQQSRGKVIIKEINPFVGDIQLKVTTTGIVEPQNRLEVKSFINGRIEEILVKEGAKVKKGDILAWMSSNERAALIDAALFQGDQTRQYWEQVYKKTPIISPIDGEIIVRSVEPGQTITTSEPILVVSDQLIINAQFDETDIGRVKSGQKAVISLDAYPNYKVDGLVGHVAYESKLVNNVTTYDVDIMIQEIPEFFRSGMSANVEVIEKERKEVLLIPVSAIQEEGGKEFVMIKNKQNNAIQERPVRIGVTDVDKAEVISGLDKTDVVILKNQRYSFSKKQASGTNPFMPAPPGRKK